MTVEESYELTKALKVALNNGGFHVQADERDGGDQERMAVSFGGDDGPWFELIAYLSIDEDDE